MYSSEDLIAKYLCVNPRYLWETITHPYQVITWSMINNH